jgi:hypothetical protein
MEIRQEVLDNAVDNMNVEKVEPYMPSNGAEGELFMFRWCGKCALDLVKSSCEIQTTALCGEQPPEWIYVDEKPACTAFKKRVENENKILS